VDGVRRATRTEHGHALANAPKDETSEGRLQVYG
jgi:hypothetical protein